MEKGTTRPSNAGALMREAASKLKRERNSPHCQPRASGGTALPTPDFHPEAMSDFWPRALRDSESAGLEPPAGLICHNNHREGIQSLPLSPAGSVLQARETRVAPPSFRRLGPSHNLPLGVPAQKHDKLRCKPRVSLSLSLQVPFPAVPLPRLQVPCFQSQRPVITEGPGVSVPQGPCPRSPKAVKTQVLSLLRGF